MGLQKFKNVHQGERAVLIGNGPSVESIKLETIEPGVTFATKEIHKLYEKTSWRPDYYIQSGTKDRYYDWVEYNLQEGATCFVNDVCAPNIPRIEGVYDINMHMIADDRIKHFTERSPPESHHSYWSDDIKKKVFWYNMSVYPMYQLAAYMGFAEIILIGCDLGIDQGMKVFEGGFDPYEILYNLKLHPYSSYDFQLLRNSIDTYGVLDYLNLIGALLARKPFKNGANPMYADTSNSKCMRWINFLANSDFLFKSFINGIHFKLVYEHLNILFTKNYNFGNYRRVAFLPGEDDRQRRAHELARRKLHNRGIVVVNVNLNSKLDVFPKKSFDSVFSV